MPFITIRYNSDRYTYVLAIPMLLDGPRRRGSRSRTLSQDGDSSDGHSSELGYTYDLPPPVPPLPSVSVMQGSPSSAPPTHLKPAKKSTGLLRSPSFGSRNRKNPPVEQQHQQELSPITPRAALFPSNSGNETFEPPSPSRASMQIINKANEALHTARKGGLGAAPDTTVGGQYAGGAPMHQAPSKLGSFAAMDKIAKIEDDIRETKFLALLDRSSRAESGVLKLSLASTAAREAGIV
jgi:hypothetical protein